MYMQLVGCSRTNPKQKAYTVHRIQHCKSVHVSPAGVFEYHPIECDPGDEEAEMDDDPVLDTGQIATACTCMTA